MHAATNNAIHGPGAARRTLDTVTPSTLANSADRGGRRMASRSRQIRMRITLPLLGPPGNSRSDRLPSVEALIKLTGCKAGIRSMEGPR
jgi:hypothetical protein